MKQLRLGALVCGAALVAAAGLQAQNPSAGPTIKQRVVSPEKYQEMRAGGTREVSGGEETLRHGDFLSLSRADGSRLTGTLVYQDARANLLVIRPAAGAAPVAVPMKDVEEVERIVPASTAGGDKGGVKFAGDEDVRRAAPSYEIQVQEIFNGSTRSVRYFGKPLSPAETEQLAQLEQAANEQAEAAAQVQALTDQLARANLRDDRTAAPAGSGFAFSSFTTAFPTNNGLFQNGPFAPDLYGAGPTTAALPAVIAATAAERATTVVPSAPAVDAESPAETMKSLRDAQAALAKARQNYVAARDRAVFDADGRIVAVRLEQK